ncbi:MAG: Rrf2 family transcriptional regulator [Phycisphaerales bacterium]|nr:MAG: Rrf2 family transcriptional regulator [Phycisphaerales bacterium]
MAIKISKKCHYALRAVFELAARRTATPVAVGQIADAQRIPPRFLEGILNQLRQAGLVVSHRGNSGGYTLATPPEAITVAHVIEAVQGPISVAAVKKGQSCGYIAGDAAFEQFWETLDASMAECCGQTSFADLMRWEVRSERRPVLDYVI